VLGTVIRYQHLLLADQSASVTKSCQVEDEWENAGELNQQMLTELTDELEGTSPGVPVRLLDPPAIEGDDPPLATSVKQLQTYSFEAWFELQDPPQDRAVELVGKREISRHHGQVSLEATREGETLVVRPQLNTS
jgi:hypothetical protein